MDGCMFQGVQLEAKPELGLSAGHKPFHRPLVASWNCCSASEYPNQCILNNIIYDTQTYGHGFYVFHSLGLLG
jgi:hypothetical protein